jgi:Dockerin type I domain
MFAMVRHSLKKHKVKIAFGVPMIFLLASSLSFVRDTEEICIVPDDNRFVEVGETVTLHVLAQADEPVNVIGATIQTPLEYVEVTNISREDSLIDLWSEEPSVSSTGAIHFSGGIIRPEGFVGEGTILTLVVTPLKEGSATLTFEDTKMLAHDGTGMEVTCGENPITLSIRPASYPSPDVNGDKQVNLYDFGIVSTRYFMAYERMYDLNLDGKITFVDIGILLSNIKGTSKLGSLAISLSR